jgi:DNA-binding transcriptional LysR family regulator
VLEELRGGVDVAIRRGVAHADAWPQHHVVPVLDDVDTLIMSPALFRQRPILTPADIEGHTLLASETRAGDWSRWLEAAGVPQLAGLPRQLFDHFYVTRQAVEDGLGLGIGPLPLLAIDVANNKLITPLPDIRVPRTGYVAIFPRQADAGNLLHGFVDWLASQPAVS